MTSIVDNVAQIKTDIESYSRAAARFAACEKREKKRVERDDIPMRMTSFLGPM